MAPGHRTGVGHGVKLGMVVYRVVARWACLVATAPHRSSGMGHGVKRAALLCGKWGRPEPTHSGSRTVRSCITALVSPQWPKSKTLCPRQQRQYRLLLTIDDVPAQGSLREYMAHSRYILRKKIGPLRKPTLRHTLSTSCRTSSRAHIYRATRAQPVHYSIACSLPKRVQ